uniref:F-box domain-containing protein n=1 Tax=Kalanchoe fedtschenkoi TaxID=63787 RepID=A0A7N0VHC2_KALFE
MDMNDEGGKLSESPDRISDMPDSVIECILSRLPLQDMVRTSILSTNWRLHWTKVPELILNLQFFLHLLNYEPFRDYDDEEISEMSKNFKYVTTVSRMLLVHGEPIHKFFLLIPFRTLPPDVNLWIYSVSRKGVKRLTLHAYYNQFKVPSYVYHCTELKHFRLAGCELCPSQSFRGFSHLLNLEVAHAKVSGDAISTLISGCPLLERVSLDCIFGEWASVFTKSVSAPKLKQFLLQSLTFINVIFTRTPELTIVSYGYYDMDLLPTDIKLSNIVQFFGSVPKIEDITLSGNVLSEFGKHDVPERLLAPLGDLRSLTLIEMNICTPDNLLSAFCILKSSLHLHKLNILVESKLALSWRDAVDYLEAQQRAAPTSFSLKTVKIKELLGRPPEVLLIEILLSSCLMLEKMYLFGHHYITPDNDSKMLAIATRLRASTKAEIIYSRSSAFYSPFNFWCKQTWM